MEDLAKPLPSTNLKCKSQLVTIREGLIRSYVESQSSLWVLGESFVLATGLNFLIEIPHDCPSLVMQGVWLQNLNDTWWW